jgi:hypothetical protein
MSLVKLTSEGEVRLMRSRAKPDVYERWLAMLPPGAYDRIVEAMNRKIDRMDVVRAQYVVCERADKWFDGIRNRLAGHERGQETVRSVHWIDPVRRDEQPRGGLGISQSGQDGHQRA